MGRAVGVKKGLVEVLDYHCIKQSTFPLYPQHTIQFPLSTLVSLRLLRVELKAGEGSSAAASEGCSNK